MNDRCLERSSRRRSSKGNAKAPKEGARLADDPYKTLYLVPNAPSYVVEAVYRALAKMWHPDVRPASEKDKAIKRMVALNRAVEQIRSKAGRAS